MEGALAAANGTAAIGRGEEGVWNVGGEWGAWAVEGVSDEGREFGVWWGELGVPEEWGGSDGGDELDSREEVMGAPAFAGCAPRRAFSDLANSALVAESITDAAPRQTNNKD